MSIESLGVKKVAKESKGKERGVKKEKEVKDLVPNSNESDACESRYITFQSDIVSMKYGEVDRNNPAYEYVEDIVGKLPGADGLGIRVRIIPQNYSPNAHAFADGTIGITTSMFKFAESYEALAGVVAHEKCHVSSEHLRKDREAKSKELSPRSLLEQFGASRLHEYEADLRASLGDLNSAQINPLGFKILLQKLGERERGSRYSSAHGSSVDRALNIAAGSYLMDLKSLSGSLTQIPNSILEAVEQAEPAKHSALFIRPKDTTGIVKTYDERVENRRKSIEELETPEQLLIAFNAISRYSKKEEGEDYDPDDDKCLSMILGRLSEHMRGSSKESNRLGEIILLSYFTGVKLDKIDSLYAEDSEKKPVRMSELFKYLETAGSMNLFKYKLSSDSSFCADLAGMLKNRKLLRANESHTIERFEELLHKFGEQYSFEEQKEGAFGVAVENEFSEETDGSKSKEKIVDNIDSEQNFWNKLETKGYDAEIFALAREVLKDYGICQIYESADRIVSKVKELVKGEDIDKMFSLVSDVFGIFESYVLFVNSTNRGAKLEDIFFEAEEKIIPPYLALKIVEELFKKGEEFGSLDEEQKKFYRILISNKVNLRVGLAYIQERIQSAETNVEEIEHDWFVKDLESTHEPSFDDVLDDISDELEREQSYNYVWSELKKNELSPNEIVTLKEIVFELKTYSLENFDFEVFDEDRVMEVYRHFVNNDFASENHFNISKNPNDCSDIFLESLNRYAEKVDIRTFIDFIKRGQEEYPDFIDKSLANLVAAGNISTMIADACEDETIWDMPVKDILLISRYVSNSYIKNKIENVAVERNWEKLNFDEKLELLFPEDGQNGIVSFELRERFFCEEVNTKEKYAQVRSIIESSIDELFNTRSARAGGAVLIDRIDFRYSNPVEFLDSGLKTNLDDSSLRHWIEESRSNIDSFNELVGIPYDDRDEGAAIRRQIEIDKYLETLYTLGPISKRALVRKLLVGEHGLLTSTKFKRDFFDVVFNNWIEEGEKEGDLADVLDKIKDALIDEPSWELLYFGIQGIVADKLFIPPPKPSSRSFITSVNAADSSNSGLQKTLVAEAKLRRILVDKDELTSNSQRITPIEFIKEVAGNLGALGRRFLQVLPQFIELPERYEKEFSDVYDRVAGQSKLSAIATVEREWPEVWDELPEIKGKIGGGSIVTVFEAVNKDGRREVLKVRNPNILYHLDESERVVANVASRLSEKHGGSYDQAKSIVPDISEWVTNDVNFENFLEEDREFKGKYIGYTVNKNRYKVKIPDSYGPANPFFSREEYLPGTNLTSIDEIAKSEKHDVKEVIGLLAKFYMKQIIDGKLHSDVHPGNYSVTDDYELVMYDRNYYVTLSSDERSAILSLFNPFVSVEQKIGLVSKAMATNGEAKEAVAKFVSTLSSGDVDGAKKSIIDIKAAGVVMPLNFTLLLKNISAIQSLAKKAGYGSIFEALR